MNLVFRNLTSDKKYTSKLFEKILYTALKLVRSDLTSLSRIEVSINLVGEGKIRELNRKYRKKNKVTDVLSFPMVGNLKSLPAYQLTSLPALDLGDLFICLSFAKKEAKRENISIERKLAQLTVHGFLHLLGYDHEGPKAEAKEMFSLEDKILSKIGDL